MNNYEKEQSRAEDELSRQKARLQQGFDRTVDRVEKTMDVSMDYAKEKAQDARNAVAGAATDATAAVSKAVDKTVSTVSDSIEAGKHYLAEHDLEKIADDFTGVIKKYPIQALFCGVGLGILLGNTLSRR